MKLSRPLLAVLFVALIVIGLWQSIEIRGPDRPMGTPAEIATLSERDDLNLVVVVIDTLRADRLSSYGYERETSPIMDAMADSGIRFSNVLAQSTWTKTSMASMFTATYPSKNKITRFNHVVPDGATLASEIFQDAGFKTVGIWRNGWVKDNFGFNQGWDVYVKPFGIVQQTARNPSAAGLAGNDQEVIAAAVQFLRTVGDQRFYLYLHLMDLHQYRYDGSVDFGRGYSDIYDQSIHWVDSNVGHLVAVLQRLGLMKRTVIAIVSDHGEAFLEHDSEGHAANLYHETTNVPFILTLPFRLEEPIVVETPVENVDIYPTVLDLLGLPGLPEADGESLVPLVQAAAQGQEPSQTNGPDTRFAFLDNNWGRPSEPPRPFVLVERDGYRFHGYDDVGQHLFDAREDVGELNDIAEEQPDVVAEMQETLRSFLETPEASWGGPGWVEIDEMEAGQLRALGYAIETHAPPGERRKP